MKKSLIIASLLAATLGSAAVIAERDKSGDCDRGEHRHMRHHDGMSEHHMRGGKMMDREFSAEQIRTLTEARLIMQGNENLQVGKISSSDNGYTINIVTKDGSLVEEREVAKNGMPVEMYEKMKKRMEERKADK